MVAWLWSKLGTQGRYVYWLLFCQLVMNLNIYEKKESFLLLRFTYVYECFVCVCLYTMWMLGALRDHELRRCLHWISL